MDGPIGQPDGEPIVVQPAADAIRVASGGGSVALWVQDDVLWIQMQGGPPGEALLRCIRQGLLAGQVRHSMPTVVDLSRFDGVIDWPSLRAVLALAPWGKGAPVGAGRVGYVVRDGWFGMVIKVVRIMFPMSQHRTFPDVAGALAWVRETEAEYFAATD